MLDQTLIRKVLSMSFCLPAMVNGDSWQQTEAFIVWNAHGMDGVEQVYSVKRSMRMEPR